MCFKLLNYALAVHRKTTTVNGQKLRLYFASVYCCIANGYINKTRFFDMVSPPPTPNFRLSC